MGDNQKLKGHFVTGLGRMVKGAGLALLLEVLVICIGEGPPNLLKLKGIELIQMVNFLTALVGLALAVWKQGIGGAVTTIGILLFVFVETIGRVKLFVGTWFLLIGFIGVLNIVCWWLKKQIRF
jgi:hypothetical protein